MFHYRNCDAGIMAAETKVRQLKGRGVRGLKIYNGEDSRFHRYEGAWNQLEK